MNDECQATTEPAPDSPAPSLVPSAASAEDHDHALAEAVADLLAAGQRVEAGQLLRSGPTEDERTRRMTVGWDVWPPHR